MEITGQIRTELIELVRAARSIVDTGWPRDPDAPPEIAQMENFLRANLLNTVAGNLFYMAGRTAAETSDPPSAMESLIELIRETNNDLNAQADIMNELSARITGNSSEVVRLSKAIGDLAGRVRELAGVSPE